MDYEIVPFYSIEKSERFKLAVNDHPLAYDSLPEPEYRKFFVNTYQPIDSHGAPTGPPENELRPDSKVARRI